MAAKLKVLHVIGSPQNEFTFKLNNLYFAKCLEYGNYVFHYAVVWPGGLWSFPEHRDDLQSEEVPKYEMDGALARIKSLAPDVICPHFFCYPGTTKYRSVLELLGIPIVGNLSRKYEITMDKALTKASLQQIEGVRVPQGKIVQRQSRNKLDTNFFKYPVIVKPTMEENSIGITLARNPDDLERGLDKAFLFGDSAIVEQFIEGREIRCGLFQNTDGSVTHTAAIEYCIGAGDIRTFEDKLSTDKNGLPAGKSKTNIYEFMDRSQEVQLAEKLEALCEAAHRGLGLRDYSLFDIRVDEDGEPHILEVNLFCAFSPDSFLCLMSKPKGWTHEKIFDVMVTSALTRKC